MRILRVLVPALAALTLFALPVRSEAAANQDQNIYVEPALVQAEMKPGTSRSISLNVRSAQDTSVFVSTEALGQDLDGGFRILDGEAEAGAYTAMPYIAVSPTRLDLTADVPKKVDLQITIPQDAGEGGRYAVVEFSSESGDPQGGGGGVGVTASVGATVVITLDGTEQMRTGEITDVDLDRTTSPTSVKTVLNNTGNYHYGSSPYRVFAGATLLDSNGNQIGAAISPMTEGSVVPSFSRQLTTNLAIPEGLPPGRYSVRVEVALEDGTIIDTDTREFDLTETDVLGEEKPPVDSSDPLAPGSGGDDDFWLYLMTILVAGLALGLFFFITFGRRRRREEPTPGDGPPSVS